ncbi:MAG: sensor histidine kinase [Eubacteriales bacterium]|nr:sensor histidine kinase [Eubacteriales bacterium]
MASLQKKRIKQGKMQADAGYTMGSGHRSAFIRGLPARMRAQIRMALRLDGLQFRITVSSTAIALVAIAAVSFTLYGRYRDSAIDRTLLNNMQLVDQVGANLNAYLDEMSDLSSYLEAQISQANSADDLETVFSVISGMRTDVVTMAVFNPEGTIMASSNDRVLKPQLQSGENIRNQDWFQTAVSGGDKPYTAPHVQNLYYNNYRWVISHSRAINWNRMLPDNQVVLLVDMNFRLIEQLCSQVQLGRRGYVFIMDDQGDIVYHPQQQMLYLGVKREAVDETLKLSDGSHQLTFDGQELSASIFTLNEAGWRLVGINYLDDIVASSDDMRTLILILVLLGTAMVFFISIQLAAFMTRPLQKLQRRMKEVEAGALNTVADLHGAYEVKQLTNSFNAMISQIQQLMNQVIDDHHKLRKSEMKALQAQINPHFLYNTLDSIVWLAEDGDNQSVVTMVSALARFFRLSISGGHDLITIADELRHAENYLIIQSIRYKDRFDYVFDADESILDCRTVKILLQPVLENAIHHGIEKSVDFGHIVVQVRDMGDKIMMRVSDNGLGMSQETLNKIFEINPSRSSGIGVKNVHQRIQLYFGKEYGLKISSELEEGTTVEIWLSKTTGGDSE